eukprot:908016-Pelagomonas_calceolata.AAC.1
MAYPVPLAKISAYPCQNIAIFGSLPQPPGPPEYAPVEVPNHYCWSGKPGGCFLRNPFWQGFCLIPSPTPWATPGTECAELLS